MLTDNLATLLPASLLKVTVNYFGFKKNQLPWIQHSIDTTFLHWWFENAEHILWSHSIIIRLSIIFRMNLYELIKKNNFQGFSIALIRRFAYALLQSLRMLHHERIIHCDLKPENILLRQKGQSSIKVIDFGSSCYEHQRGKYFRINFITAAD